MGLFRVISVALTVSLLSGCFGRSDPGDGQPAASISLVKDMGSVAQDGNLRGRDGGYSGQWNDRLVWVFGDSVTRRANRDGQNWFSNTWSATDDFDATDGLDPLELGTDEAGEVTELLPYTLAEQRFNSAHQSGPDCESPCGARYALWPGPILADPARNRSLVFYQKVYAEPGELNFHNVGYSIALWDNDSSLPSRPIINTGASHPTLLFSNTYLQPGIGAIIEQDTLYTFICHHDWIDVPCGLARVPLASVLDPGAWQYAGSGGQWQSEPTNATDLFLGADIMSVAYNEYLKQYVVVYSEPLGGPIVLRTAPKLIGPWSKPVVIAYPLSSDSTNGWVYDGLMHPELSVDGQRVLYVTYTRDVRGEREMRLLRVRLDHR